MAGRARDNQRSKVYNWEDTLSHTQMTLAACEALANKMRAVYGLGPVLVKDGRGTRRARAFGSSISLPSWARTNIIVLHETAHTIDAWDNPSHGPVFMRIYIDLLTRSGVGTNRELTKSAKATGIKVAPSTKSKSPMRPRLVKTAIEALDKLTALEYNHVVDQVARKRQNG